jgi:hypothetical protein
MLGLVISISSYSSAVKYSCIVVITPNTQNASSDSKTKCLQFSNTARILRPKTQTRTSCSTPRALPLCDEVVPALWLLVARKELQSRPPCRYLRFRRVSLLDSMKPFDTTSATVIIYLHLSSGKRLLRCDPAVQPYTTTESARLPREVSALRSSVYLSQFSRGSITLITPNTVPVIRCNGRSFSYCQCCCQYCPAS